MTTRLAAIAASAAIALLALTGCSTTATAPTTAPPTTDAASGPCVGDSGVTVIVNVGNLDTPKDPSLTTCVITDTAILGVDALKKAGVTTEGTTQYGDQVVCRVNGVPSADLVIPAADGSAYKETCATMPAANAYWAVWLKPAGGTWDYAQEGLTTLKVEPGQSVELLFALNGEPAAPTD